MFTSFVFKVSALIPGVRPLPAPGPTEPSCTALLLFHTHMSPFTFASGRKRKPNVKKNNLYQQERVILPNLQPFPCELPGLGVQENTGTPSPVPNRMRSSCTGKSPLSSTSVIMCHLHTRPDHHQRLLTTGSRGSKKQTESVPMGACEAAFSVPLFGAISLYGLANRVALPLFFFFFIEPWKCL